MTAQMNAQPLSAPSRQQQAMQGEAETRREQTNLKSRYGSIGIEAVAAAVRYAGATKNPAYAPVVSRAELRFLEPIL